MGRKALFRQLAAESTAWERDGLVRRFSTHSEALLYGRVTKQEERKTLPHSNKEGGLPGPLFPEKETEAACSDTTLAGEELGPSLRRRSHCPLLLAPHCTFKGEERGVMMSP